MASNRRARRIDQAVSSAGSDSASMVLRRPELLFIGIVSATLLSITAVSQYCCTFVHGLTRDGSVRRTFYAKCMLLFAFYRELLFSMDDPNTILISNVDMGIGIQQHQLEIAGVGRLDFLIVIKSAPDQGSVLVFNQTTGKLEIVSYHFVLAVMDMYRYGLAVFHQGDAFEFVSGAAVFIKACPDLL